MAHQESFIGLMSGTSLDGIDGVIADLGAPRMLLLAHVHHAFEPQLRSSLERLSQPGPDELHCSAVAANELARAYAEVVADLLRQSGIGAAQVRAIGAHGQTVRHRPDAAYTVQLNAPALLAELSGIDVVADFRSRDLAAGGQGAPLVPAFHAAVFGNPVPRAVVNIGGISNVSALPTRAGHGTPLGFDCGPGNTLIDHWAQRHLGEPFDRDGRWASRGRVIDRLLDALLCDPYFSRPPPKSTGRELFNAAWLDRLLKEGDRPVDVAATLTRLTARAIARAIRTYSGDARELVVCGGGALNPTLMQALAEECTPMPVISSAAAGIDPQHVEALAFAWLAREFVARRPGNLPTVTGARGLRVLGALYPR
jgi:anhydro-N-acetylmuramic acid kinase